MIQSCDFVSTIKRSSANERVIGDINLYIYGKFKEFKVLLHYFGFKGPVDVDKRQSVYTTEIQKSITLAVKFSGEL